MYRYIYIYTYVYPTINTIVHNSSLLYIYILYIKMFYLDSEIHMLTYVVAGHKGPTPRKLSNCPAARWMRHPVSGRPPLSAGSL